MEGGCRDCCGRRRILEAKPLERPCNACFSHTFGLEGMTVCTDVLNLIDSAAPRHGFRDRWCRWVRSDRAHHHRVVVDADVVLGKLVGGIHTASCRPRQSGSASRSCHVDRVHGGAGSLGGRISWTLWQSMQTATLASPAQGACHARWCGTGLTGRAQAGIELANVGRIRVATAAQLRICRRSTLPFHPPCGSWPDLDRSWLRASVATDAGQAFCA